ncbi:hypothetical protein L208DRAFT_1375214 [Tricholoma matsutake]|nr:hypothetical protein L208DRAFT_1375214 [Tricholoma matsutake 945]
MNTTGSNFWSALEVLHFFKSYINKKITMPEIGNVKAYVSEIYTPRNYDEHTDRVHHLSSEILHAKFKEYTSNAIHSTTVSQGIVTDVTNLGPSERSTKSELGVNSEPLQADPDYIPKTAFSSRTFTLASRASQLAQIQTNIVLATLQALFPPPSESTHEHAPVPIFKTSFMATSGDKNQSQALYLLGGKALWTKELEVVLREGAVDMIIHSLKDVPTTLPEGCVIGAILEREDPVDSLVVKCGKSWKSLEDLPGGSVVGTSSVRRVAQLKRNFPKLKFLDVIRLHPTSVAWKSVNMFLASAQSLYSDRLNRNTRFAKLDAPDGPYAALILARAGIVRLGMSDRITSDLRPPILYHAVSQGALAVEVRSDDIEAIELCKKLNHWETEWKCLAERACLRVLEGGCSVPVGVSSALEVDASETRAGVLTLTGCVTAINGDVHVEHTLKNRVGSAEQAEEVGKGLARVLLDSGAKKVLDDINKDRNRRVEDASK